MLKILEPSGQILKEKLVKNVKSTFLASHGKTTCLACILTYMLLQVFFYRFGTTICTHRIEYSNLAKSTTLLSALCFSVGCVLQLKSIVYRTAARCIYSLIHTDQEASDNMRDVNATDVYANLNLATFVINFIAGSSCFLTYFLQWGGVCKDGFGYAINFILNILTALLI